PSPVHADGEFDFYIISYKSYMTTYADTATNPILMDVAKHDPHLMRIVINTAAGRKRGLKSGDLAWVESRYAKAKGVIGLSEGIHPETAAVSGGFGRWTKHPIAH